MRKSFKKGLALALAAALAFSTPVAVSTVSEAGTTTAEATIVSRSSEVEDSFEAGNWWSAWSNYYQLKGDFDVTFDMTWEAPAITANWNTPSLYVASDADRGDTEGGYKEYAGIRLDNFANNLGSGDNKTAGGNDVTFESDYDWGTFQNEMKSADLKVQVKRTGNQIEANYVITSKSAEGTVRNYKVTFEEEMDKAIRLFWTGENGKLTIKKCDISYPFTALEVAEKKLAADTIERKDNPLKGEDLQEVTLEYTLNLDADAVANGWDGLMSFFDSESGNRVSIQTHPYVCYNATATDKKFIDYKANALALQADEKGTDVAYKIVISAEGITMYKNGTVIESGIAGQSGPNNADGNTGEATYADILSLIQSAPEFTIGVGLAATSYWNTEKSTLKNIKISAVGNAPQKDENKVNDLIKDPKAVASGNGIEVTYELADANVTPDSVEVKAGEDTVALTDGKYIYVPAASGEYKFTVTAKKGDVTDTKEVAIKVAVEDGKVLLDADLVSDLKVTDGGEVYNVTWTAMEGTSCSAVVSDGKKTIATLTESGGQIKKADMTSGVKYTVTLTGTKEGYASKKLTADVTYTAPKADAPGAKPGTDLTKITAKPVLSYTFDNANGLQLAGDAKVSGGVLNLASSTTQKNKSYAKIGSLASYDFSKGFTWTADVKVNAATASHDWTSILMLGDSTPGNELKGTASTVGYHFTTALSTFMDFDRDFDSTVTSIKDKDNVTSKVGFCGSAHVFPYGGTGFDSNIETGVGVTPLNGYTFDRYEWYKDATKCGRWDTITVTVTPDTMTLYYDGVAQLTYKDTNYAKILAAAKKFTSNYIGTSYWSGDFDFSGSIDNLAFYNTALSAEDVKKLTSTTADQNTTLKPQDTSLKTIKLTNISAKAGAKKITGTVNAPKATVEVKVGKAAYKKATVSGNKFTLNTSKLKIGTKIVFKVTAEGYTDLTWNKIVRGDFKLSAVKAKKGKKQITGKVNVKKATVKIKVGKKAYKKAKLKGTKFTLKTKKLKKGTKVKIKVTKKNYNTLTKTYKVK